MKKQLIKKSLDANVQKFNTRKLVSAVYSTQFSESNQLNVAELNAIKNLMIDDLRERLKELLTISTFTSYQTGKVNTIGSLYIVDKRDEV